MNEFNPLIVSTRFQYHSGAFLYPEMYKDEYEEALLELSERQQAGTSGFMFIEDTFRHTHAINTSDIAYVACSDAMLPKKDNTTMEVDIDDWFDDWDDDDDWFEDVT